MTPPKQPEISPEMLKEAIRTSHDNCSNDNCALADAADPCNKEIGDTIEQLMAHPMSRINPADSIFFHGLHVGYRLGEMMFKSAPKEQVN